MSSLRMSAEPTRIEGRAPNGWLVSGRLHRPALLVTVDLVQSLGPLTLDNLDAALLPPMEAVDLLLLGTGETMQRPPSGFIESARRVGLRVEAMDSPAAARTFNILVAEQRRVAALLL